MHGDSKQKNNLVLSEDPTQGLIDTKITAEAQHSVNFTASGRRFVLGLHYNGSNRFLFVNATKIYQFKTKDLDISKLHTLSLGNISSGFTMNIRKKTGLSRVVRVFPVDYNALDSNDILEIHRYLLTEIWYQMFGFDKKTFVRLLNVCAI